MLFLFAFGLQSENQPAAAYQFTVRNAVFLQRPAAEGHRADVDVAGSILQGKNGSASHGQSQQDGNKENHQRVGGTDGGQCAGTYTLSYNQRVGYVVTLL